VTDLSGYQIQQQPAYGQPVEDAINLTMGIETTGGLAAGVPPEGTHRWRTEYEGRQYTQNGEVMLNIACTIIESHVPNAMGQKHIERLTIPGGVRQANDYATWQKMMKMLRMKLEGITGRPFRDDNIQLNPPRDLSGCIFVARCYHEESESEQTKDDGTVEKRKFKNSRLTDWTPPGIPQQQAPAAQGTFAGPTPGPQLGQQQMQQAQPSINLGQALQQQAAQHAAPQTLEQAAQAMAPPPQAFTPNPAHYVDPRVQGAANLGDPVAQQMVDAVQPSMEELAHRAELAARAANAAQAAQTDQDMQAATVPAAQPEAQPVPNLGLGGMSFPIGGQPEQQPAPAPATNGDPSEEPF